MFKKLVSIVVGIACLLSVTGVFATVSYDNATTSYEGDAIRVTSQITSGVAGDVTTYLVFDKDKSLDQVVGGDVVYVDQHTAAEANEVHKFVYKTTKSNIGANIAVGGNVETPGIVDHIPGGVVCIKDADSEDVYYNATPTIPAEDGYVLLQYGEGGNVPASFVGEVVTDIDAYLAADGLYVNKTELTDLSEGLDIEVRLSDAVASATTDTLRWFSADDAAAVDGISNTPSIVATGTVLGKDVVEYGILLADSKADYVALKGAFNPEDGTFGKQDGAQALPALAKNADGLFGIRVYSEDFGTTEGEKEQVYVMAYAIEKNGDTFSLVCAPQGKCMFTDTESNDLVFLTFDDFMVDEEEEIIFDDPYGEGFIEEFEE